jgi:hypothetical protein
LRVLIDSVEREANLTLLGRLITRGRLTGVLTNRLRIEQLLRKHPEIRERPIERPIVIAGLQRTGTTMLHRLIAADPRLRSLASWEALHPAPIARSAWEKQDPRFKLAKNAERGLAYIAPAFFAIHPVEADAPEEEVILLDYSFMSTVAEATFHVPSYASWLETQDQTPAYRYMKTLLQVLDWQRPGKRWVLKTPHHLEWIDTLLKVFPDATVVQTHRDPITTTASFCSMIAHGRGVFTDEVDPIEVGRHWARKVARLLQRGLEARDRNGGKAFVDVSYSALMKNPLPEVEKIYAHAGLELDAAARTAMEDARRRNTQHKYGKHEYRLEDFGLDAKTIAPTFDAYRKRFASELGLHAPTSRPSKNPFA